MTYNVRAVIIQTILLLVSGTVTLLLNFLFKSKGLENLASYCIFFTPTVFGLYILFGKYIYLKGINITKPLRIGTGLFFLLITPVIWFIKVVLFG